MTDAALLERFEQEIWSKVPHVQDGRIVNATPLVDLTDDLKDCARTVFKLDLGDRDFRIYGKFDSELPSGSIKVRAASHIIHEAIKEGKCGTDRMVIEATSGNFGIALGLLTQLGIPVVALVSRRLQEGVFKELRDENIRIMDMDMDICPAPGMESKADEMAAKATAANIRSQLSEMGFDGKPFDDNIVEIEALLAKQDIINLAIYLADIYGMFCPKQYDNQLNVDIHSTVTAPEIDQQLHELGDSLEDCAIYCSFGTGGTSGGLSRYMSEKYGKKAVHVVYPPAGQDVAGIRTKSKAEGLTLYDPAKYTEHEIDFENAKLILKYMVDKGHDIGESSALELYAALEMAFKGEISKAVVMIADGIDKYRKNFEAMGKSDMPMRVSVEDASAADYDNIVWVHTQYAPKEEGIEIIAKSLGVDKSKITVPKASTVSALLSTQQVPDELGAKLKGKSLLVCMAGNTSLMTAQVLASKGIATQSLNGGITNLPEGRGKDPGQYMQVAQD